MKPLKKLLAILMLPLVLFGCSRANTPDFQSDVFSEHVPTYDAVLGVYTAQSFIDTAYTAPTVYRLSDTLINRSEVLFTLGDNLYICLRDKTDFVIGSYCMSRPRFDAIVTTQTFADVGLDVSGSYVAPGGTMVDDRYLFFTLCPKKDATYGTLCMYDIAQMRLYVVHRSAAVGQLVTLPKQVQFVAFENESRALISYTPSSNQSQVSVTDSVMHITQLDGITHYCKAGGHNQLGVCTYYDTDSRTYTAAENLGLSVSAAEGVLASTVTVSDDDFAAALQNYPFKYQTLRKSGPAAAVYTASGGVAPLLLPAGDCALKGVSTDGRFVVFDMTGDYLPRFYDTSTGQMVVVGQLSGHMFSYQSYVSDDYIVIVTRATIADGEGNAATRQMVYAVPKAKL